MDVLLLIGRIAYALIFIASGIMGHLVGLDGTSQYAASKGLNNARMMVMVSGVMILVGGLFIALGLWMDLGAILLIIFLVSAMFLIHTFWKIDDEMESQMTMTHFMKDLALAGAALMLLGFMSLVDEVPLSISDRLFLD